MVCHFTLSHITHLICFCALMTLTWIRCRLPSLLLLLHVDHTLPLPLHQLHHFCPGEAQLPLVKRSEVTGAQRSLRGAAQHLGWTTVHWGWSSGCLRRGGSCSVQAWIIKLAVKFYVHSLGVCFWIGGHFLFLIWSTTLPVAVGGWKVKLADPQLGVTPTFHLDVQKTFLLRFVISHPIFHHFSEGGGVMENESSAPAREPTATASSPTSSLLPCSPAGDPHVDVRLVRILRAPIVRVQELQPRANEHTLMNTQNTRRPLQQKMDGSEKWRKLTRE